ncbi:uncharacterized protein BDZ99DRAFT_517749 [Mytilinidion resinicola]|uniref:GED domain-containing protein n=1 Tax=Mytilinidion resinicola TaxID=574789 RepID=A0A6A6YX38_9PEZI|nr:uncharacterized protein BDZ99DRAFT_517749 [Mytilinidion resinicola]KAF2813496.1 hypothetical protein BDZ99DRAFT_517749 [Mytilinidion resinicola]
MGDIEEGVVPSEYDGADTLKSDKTPQVGTPATTGDESRSEAMNGDYGNISTDTGGVAKPSSIQMSNYATLARLLTDENREMLDIVTSLARLNIRKSVISLPQLVVCGDQSKSSVLEAATGIAFPRKSGLCTRFPTEISLRRDDIRIVKIQINPHPDTPKFMSDRMERFNAIITDFNDLPRLIAEAQTAMGVGEMKTFAKDVLCIEMSGPDLPHLTLVDLPGLIKNAIDGVTPAEVLLVNELTDEYIKQHRAICLPVISATHDFANQGIVGKVQTYDASGNRTLGIVTKPDKCEPGGGESKAAIALVQNKRVALKLGWHVLRNRNEDETNRNTNIMERNLQEKLFLKSGGWVEVSEEHKGAEALSRRLSELLIRHTKRELPNVRQDVEAEYAMRSRELEAMGKARQDAEACKDFLLDLSFNYDRVCKAAVDGHYEGAFFQYDDTLHFNDNNKLARRRLRAMIQYKNVGFSDMMRVWGRKYHILRADDATANDEPDPAELTMRTECEKPVKRSHDEALDWVERALIRSRGRELHGNFNPLIIGELLWEQSAKWHQLAKEHLNDAFSICTKFLRDLLDVTCPSDVTSRVWTGIFEKRMKAKKQAAVDELQRLMDEIKSQPINYNYYYTDMVTKNRVARQRKLLRDSIENGTTSKVIAFTECGVSHTVKDVDVDKVLDHYTETFGRDVDEYSCEGILDCVLAIYKVHQKTFVANVTTQVVERHIVRGLEDIFSPRMIAKMPDHEVVTIACEPVETKNYRAMLEENVKKLDEGRELLREIVRTTAQE